MTEAIYAKSSHFWAESKAAYGGMPEDFLTIDLMAAYEHLGVITGESLEDDLVNEIFSKFCMGK